VIELLGLIALLIWGTIAGVDLVSFPQGMLGRPLVAATVAGLVLGDLETGLRVGVLLECFALDVLPVGASRYPDYGPAAVVTVFAHGRAAEPDPLGAAIALGLIVAILGGRGMEVQRRLNGRLVSRESAALAAGDPTVLARLQRRGLLHDAARSLLVTAAGMVLAVGLIPLVDTLRAGGTLTLVAIGGALMAALSGTLRRAAGGLPRVLLGAGLVVGGLLAWLA
jgi:PTS system mannose-specific IIC component